MTARTALLFLLIMVVIVALVIAARAQSDPPVTLGASTGESPGLVEHNNAFPSPGVTALRVKLHAEHARYMQAKRRVRELQHVLMHRPSVREAITLACSVYGSCSTLWRRADCESGLNPSAQNPSGASGLFQFLGSTFRSTPFGSLSVWSPYANALAAGWMQANGRGGEWVCR